jgi:hypothetical protein
MTMLARYWRDYVAVLWCVLVGILLVCCGAATGCSAARTGCDVIDVADHACEVLVLRVQQPDGTTREVRVPRGQLLELAREQDGGTR